MSEPSALEIVQAQLKATRAEFAQQVRRNSDLQLANAKLYEGLEELIEAPSRSPEAVERAEAVLRDVAAELASHSGRT